MASIARNRAIDVMRKKSEVSIEESRRRWKLLPTLRTAGAPGDDGRVEAIAGMRWPFGAGTAKLVLLAYYNGWSVSNWRKVRDAGEYRKDLAAPQHDGYPGVPWTLNDGL